MTPSRQQKMERVLQHRQTNLTVVLEHVFDPHNVAAVLRTADAVGIQEVYVVNTLKPPKIYWSERSARSADKWVQVHEFTDLDACLEQVRSRYDLVMAASLQPGGKDLFTLDFTKSIALVFGNEKYGCTPEILARCDGSFTIPQIGMLPSLNISVACAVTLYEAYRQKLAAGHFQQPSLSEQDRSAMLEKWSQPWLERAAREFESPNDTLHD